VRNHHGKRCRRTAILNFLSGTMFRIVLDQPAEVGDQLFLLAWLFNGDYHRNNAPCLALRGIVEHRIADTSGRYIIVATLRQHRFISYWGFLLF
jgi:hypothetical protein